MEGRNSECYAILLVESFNLIVQVGTPCTTKKVMNFSKHNLSEMQDNSLPKSNWSATEKNISKLTENIPMLMPHKMSNFRHCAKLYFL